MAVQPLSNVYSETAEETENESKEPYKLGTEPWKTYRNGNSRKGYRAIAGSRILKTTITDKRLAKAGYFDILAKYESLHI